MPKLHILSGLLEGRVIELTEERITIGRALDNMVRLEDGTVSHHHALLIQDQDGNYKIRDLNSTNGTRVNGLRIVETLLQNGDTIRMGAVEMRYEADVKKASQPLPPTSIGVDLSQVGAAAKPPPGFGSASPFGRKKTRRNWMWLWIAGMVVALLLVVWVLAAILKL